jgi:hypothetical protein
MSSPYFHHDPEQLAPDRWRTGCHYTDDHRRTWRVIVEWEPIAGRLEPMSVEVSGEKHPARAEVLRRLPLATVFAAMLSNAQDRLHRTGEFASRDDWPDWMPDRELYEQAAETFGVQRGRRLPDSLLARVAEVYREAWRVGRPVTEAVSDATGCSRSTASKRIMAARRAGLLDRIGPKGEQA